MAKAKYRVCLVDDDAAFSDSFRLAAKSAGYEAICFGRLRSSWRASNQPKCAASSWIFGYPE